MGATSFQRMRRIMALKAELDERGIEYTEHDGEGELRALLEAEPEAPEDDKEPEDTKPPEDNGGIVNNDTPGGEDINDGLQEPQEPQEPDQGQGPAKEHQEDMFDVDEMNAEAELNVLRIKAKELGIKSWQLKGIDKLKEEIAAKEGE